jgi:hypothetical protein
MVFVYKAIRFVQIREKNKTKYKERMFSIYILSYKPIFQIGLDFL